MILYRVPSVSDYIEFRGNFLFATMRNELVYLSAKGHAHTFPAEVQSAILAVFMEQEVRAEEFMPRINEPQARNVIPIEAYVSSIERLARAIRG